MTTAPSPSRLVVRRGPAPGRRYEVRELDPTDHEGDLLAVAEVGRGAFRDGVTFHADLGATQPVFTVTARQRLDLGATQDVHDPAGTLLGSLRPVLARSLVRSTWRLEAAGGLEATGTVRHQGSTVVRRVADTVPLLGAIPTPGLFQVDFVAGDGTSVLTIERPVSGRGRTRLVVGLPTAANGWVIDWRVAAATAVAVDVLPGL